MIFSPPSDWYHGRHLDKDVKSGKSLAPPGSSYSEMLCFGCVEKVPWLMRYEGHAVKAVKKVEEEGVKEEDVEVTAQDKGKAPAEKPVPGNRYQYIYPVNSFQVCVFFSDSKHRSREMRDLIVL